MIHVRQQLGDKHEVVLEFSGSLDLRAADAITTAALAQPSQVHLIIDLSRALQVYDSALGRLIDSLPGQSRTIRGLRGHQSRLAALMKEHDEHDGIHGHTD